MDLQQLLNPGPTPRARRRKQLTRDQRHEIFTLRKYYPQLSYKSIAELTGYTMRQVQWSCANPLTPRKDYRSHRSGFIKTPERQRLRDFLDQRREHRFIPWDALRFAIDDFPYGYDSVSTAMETLGFQRRVRGRRIHRTAANKAHRVRWAQDMLARFPNPEAWEAIGFSDETWAVNDPQWKQWATIHNTEDPDEFALLRRRPNGWMFWGQFAGRKKGPAFFWEKEYGGINAVKYQQHIIPLIHRFYQEEGLEMYQQDNAPCHRALSTRFALHQRGIEVMEWPANSPDLAPIENLWSWMKCRVEANYDIQSLSLAELRVAVWTAWEAIPEDFLLRLAHSMPERLRRVIENKGESIRY